MKIFSTVFLAAILIFSTSLVYANPKKSGIIHINKLKIAASPFVSIGLEMFWPLLFS